MSLDETHEALMRFASDLERFNHSIAALERDLAEKHERVDGIWQDQSRVAYDQTLANYQSRLSGYVQHEAPRFEAFLRQKTRQLDDYLRGAGR